MLIFGNYEIYDDDSLEMGDFITEITLVDGKIIDEDLIKTKYPGCYEYLVSRKSDLLSRDKGKVSKYDAWYAYGRRQGLLKEKRIIRC